MTNLRGTHLTVRFSRVVDGDTIRVYLPDQEKDESLRLLALDTEESYAGGGKPVTPWGKAAKKHAQEFFADADTVTIEFPGNEPLETCLRKYRGNYGRLLTFVHLGDVDYQETMIRAGYSPYFMKYGHAVFSDHHRRYSAAETEAQIAQLGVWNQLEVNGSEMRNYAALGTWWRLRARVIDDYRALKARVPDLLNIRLDYDTILAKAQAGETVTLFTEFRSVRRVGGRHGLISYGGYDRPFGLFIPEMDEAPGQAIIQLMVNRYISQGESHPRRSYGYVTGALSLYGERPQMTLTDTAQISDELPASLLPPEDLPERVVIAALLPDPEGADRGRETVTLRNLGPQAATLGGWRLEDGSGHRLDLDGALAAGETRVIPLPAGRMPLNNTGDEVFLFDAADGLVDHVSYSRQDVVAGQEVVFVP